MKKKTFALAGLAALATLSLTSCNPEDGGQSGNNGNVTVRKGNLYVAAPADEVYSTDGGDLDVYINYETTSGITWRKTESFTNPVDNEKYDKGELLPTWKTFAEKTKTNIREAAGYANKDSDQTYTSVETNGFVSDVDPNQKIDLMMANVTKLKEGKMLNLLGNDAAGKPYIDQMPNFKEWWNKYKSMQNQFTTKTGELYYTPYAEGFNDVERMFNMDTDMAKKVLDSTEGWDTTKTNGGAAPAKNVVQGAFYQPFIHAEKNYPDAETTVDVLLNSEKTSITIKQTTNIIKRQNEMLTRGCTGKELAEDFIKYLNEAFGDNIGETKIFKNYSDIFVSESAAYNCDELIALMRVVKANPGLITGNADTEIETFFPRGAKNNRAECISQFMQVWGVNGITSMNDKNYFGPDGKLHNATTTPGTYDGLMLTSQIYDEGLILTDFYYRDGKEQDNIYLDRYFKKNAGELSGWGFMNWDFAPATSYANDKLYGLGINKSDRTPEGYTTQGIMPVLPPLTYWATETSWNHDQALTNHTGKSLLRYIESNKGPKSGSWGIPVTSDNIPGALRLMDYLYSERGNMIQCFGPEAYWQTPTQANIDAGIDELGDGATLNDVLVSKSLLGGALSPIISDDVKVLLGAESNFYNFMREKLGATHGIGHIRHAGLDIQCCNQYAQKGLSNIKAACNTGVVVQGRNNKYDDYTWDTTAPKIGTYKDTANDFAALTNFWAQSNCTGAELNGWNTVVVMPYTTDFENTSVVKVDGVSKTLKEVKALFAIKNTTYQYAFASALGSNDKYVPDYAKASN